MTSEKEVKGKYGALIQQARKPDSQIASQPEESQLSKPEDQIASQPESTAVKEKEVNLCVKVPESLRRHWAAESKREGITMTQVIVQALTDRFGEPG